MKMQMLPSLVSPLLLLLPLLLVVVVVVVGRTNEE